MSDRTVTVVLVDDHTMLRQGLRRALEAEGITVLAEAGDGAAAIAAVVEHLPEVVLMDVSMPRLDGIEATRRIVEAVPEAQVVMLTMHVDRDTVDQALRAGAVGYLTKDSSINDVVQAVRAAASPDTAITTGLASALLREAQQQGDQVVSAREVEVLQLVADGLGTGEIAERLFISHATVKNHLASIYDKLDARDRTQAVLTAVRMGIVRLR